ncbi:hypothetical protein BD410DRAFT_288801 [Rickenella mellea]|uniref:Uncharacterized protein n=1 Tax=Rickenella mellea TaxID=50990 RepID=A0A4Y7Q254_9AGAM|nr:hypothetical protein BD410DRAFT_288801 [Rickenella mellea]
MPQPPWSTSVVDEHFGIKNVACCWLERKKNAISILRPPCAATVLPSLSPLLSPEPPFPLSSSIHMHRRISSHDWHSRLFDRQACRACMTAQPAMGSDSELWCTPGCRRLRRPDKHKLSVWTMSRCGGGHPQHIRCCVELQNHRELTYLCCLSFDEHPRFGNAIGTRE